jgi:phage shock protein PspC (stress-responsive transcriptional regulator)
MELATRAAEGRARTLERSTGCRMIAGVAGGLARYFDVDVAVVRLALAALAVAGGIGVPLYLAAWLLVPEEGATETVADRLVDRLRAEHQHVGLHHPDLPF